MSTEAERSRVTVDDLANRFRGEMVPLTSKFAYFSMLPLADDDLRQYLNDPINAVSPAVADRSPTEERGQRWHPPRGWTQIPPHRLR